MITAKVIDNEIVTAGEICEGDIYSDLCCAGHGFEVRLVIMESVYGICHNPDCPKVGPGLLYDDVQEFDFDTMLDKIAG